MPIIMSVPGDALHRKMDERGMPLADILVYGMENQDVGILIGADYYWSIVTGQTERFPNGLVAMHSMFGWLIQGTILTMQVCTKGPTVDVMHIRVENKELSELLHSFWELESLGIKPGKRDKIECRR